MKYKIHVKLISFWFGNPFWLGDMIGGLLKTIDGLIEFLSFAQCHGNFWTYYTGWRADQDCKKERLNTPSMVSAEWHDVLNNPENSED